MAVRVEISRDVRIRRVTRDGEAWSGKVCDAIGEQMDAQSITIKNTGNKKG